MRIVSPIFAFLGLFLLLFLSNTKLIHHSRAALDNDSAQQAALDKREAAYRANNIGAAFLDQYKAKEAVGSFTHALELKPDLLIARINLSIALYYSPDAEGAKREAEKSLAQDPNAPQPHYILGLIARAQNRFDEAIIEFQKVLKIDPDDVGSNINVGQIFAQQKRSAEAIVAFRRAIKAEPYNETGLYNLALLVTRSGQKEEGRRLLQKFQELKQSNAGTTLGTNYLEGGRYAEAVVSTGAEPELVDRRLPDVTFNEATSGTLPDSASSEIPRARSSSISNLETFGRSAYTEASRRDMAAQLSGGITFFDYDNDGDLDLFEVRSAEQRLYRNDSGRFTDITTQSGLLASKVGVGIAAIAGDFDNDGKQDLFVLRYGALALYRNLGGGQFQDVVTIAKIPVFPYLSVSAAFVDVDHDGDLDIFIAGFADLNKPLNQGGQSATYSPLMSPERFSPAPNLLLRNNGDGTFTDTTALAKVEGMQGHAVAVVPTDFDNRRDVDLLVVNRGGGPVLYRNMRDRTFKNVAEEVGLNLRGDFTSAAVGDVNKDGFPDFFFSDTKATGTFAVSDGHGHFKIESEVVDRWSLTFGTEDATSLFLDYDNDGMLDLLVVSSYGIRLLRNVGDSWSEVGSEAVSSGLIQAVNRANAFGPGPWLRAFAAGDIDGDGDTDLILRSATGGLRFARNDGGNRNNSIAVNLHGRVSNKSAVEAKVEMRAGSLWQKLETYSASPAPAPADLIFGLGKRQRPDAVRIIWPAGIVQAETEFPAQKRTLNLTSLNITELDRKPSSCPYLYTWNGDRFEFITDFMGGGEMGYLEEPGRYNKPDPVEYVRVRGDQLKERNGRYELRVTNELEEAMYVDRLQLMVVAHPIGTEVYPNEGMSDPPKPFKLFFTRGARPPARAVDDKGHDVLELISRLDRRWPGDFKIDRIRGYAEDHTLTLRLPDTGSADVSPALAMRRETEKTSQGERIVLLLTGWTDYAWSSDNLAASQAGKTMTLPALQVKDKEGNWRTVIEDIGIPVGRPQTVTVDLTDKFLSENREVRIVTNMRIYWDQILVDTSYRDSPTRVSRLDASRADLWWRGFSYEGSPDNHEPFGYDYQRVSFNSPWKLMTGHYTREGDVRELLFRSDDMFVICRPGDEISLSFNATTLPSLPAGWTRTFLVYADGFSKEMDINSASPDQVMPLPFHGMSRYPYKWPEQYPLTDERRTYLEKYNTRIVKSTVPSIETVMVRK